MKLTSDLHEFVLSWGELASHWGLNRTEAQIHALLFISEEPLTAEEIAEILQVVPSHVSTCVRELLSWRIVSRRSMPGQRSAVYTAKGDVWEMFRTVVEEQKRREIDPFIDLVRSTKRTLDGRTGGGSRGVAHAQNQVSELHAFFESFLDWYDFMSGLSTGQIKRYLKLGKKVRALLGERS